VTWLKAGAKESAIKFIKIMAWVAFSAMVTKLATMVSDWKPTTAEWVIVQGLLNSAIPSLVKWVATKE
jgi:hypothetical protein